MPNIDLDSVREASHVESPDGMPKGSRNWELYRFACSQQALGVSDEDMVAKCLAAAATMDPPLDDAEVLRIVKSAQTKEKGTAAASSGRRREVQRSVPAVPRLLRTGHPERLPDWSGVSGVAMARAWVMALFEPLDVVCIARDMTMGFRGGHGGEIHAYAGQLADPGDRLLEKIVAGAGPNGLWGVINPLDGSGGRKGENVTSYRNLLVECDELDSDAQLERICAILMNGSSGGPDTVSLTWSGGKSWHAVVRLDAIDAKDYAARKDWVYRLCAKNGLPVDEHCGNPTRFTRVAGAMRGNVMQAMAHCRRPGPAWRGGPSDWAGR